MYFLEWLALSIKEQLGNYYTRGMGLHEEIVLECIQDFKVSITKIYGKNCAEVLVGGKENMTLKEKKIAINRNNGRVTNWWNKVANAWFSLHILLMCTLTNMLIISLPLLPLPNTIQRFQFAYQHLNYKTSNVDHQLKEKYHYRLMKDFLSYHEEVSLVLGTLRMRFLCRKYKMSLQCCYNFSMLKMCPP